MTEPLTDDQLAAIQAELAPLAGVIATVLQEVTVRVGNPADAAALAAVLTTRIAAHLGPLVGDVPEQQQQLHSERDRYRAAWHSARQRAAERNGALDVLAEEYDRLLMESAEGIANQTLLKGLSVVDGQVQLEIEPARELLLVLVASMREMLDDAGAENYLTTEVTFPPAVHLDLQDGQHPDDSYTVTVQRRHRPTAHDLRRRVEAERDAARAQVAAARAAAQIADPDDVTDWQRGYRACSTLVLAALDRAADPTTT